MPGLLGGPLVGVAAGAAGQVVSTSSVWRRRFAEGGLGSIQGWAAGVAGGLAWTGAEGVAAMAAVALAAAVAVNTAGRAAIILARGTRPFRDILVRGLAVDVVEAVIMTPLLAVLAYTAITSEALTAAALAAGLAMLTIAHNLRLTTIEALAAEQANARRDQLTGAPNRRAFEEALAAEHARVVRGSLPAGLFVVDIDRFKTINDRFGHAVGDEALVTVVRRLTESLRPSDVVARWGGEEITVLAPGLGGRQALERFAGRIRTIVGEHAAGDLAGGHPRDRLGRRHAPRRVGRSPGGASLCRRRALRREADARHGRDTPPAAVCGSKLPSCGVLRHRGQQCLASRPRSGRLQVFARRIRGTDLRLRRRYAPSRRVTAASAPSPMKTVPET